MYFLFMLVYPSVFCMHAWAVLSDNSFVDNNKRLINQSEQFQADTLPFTQNRLFDDIILSVFSFYPEIQWLEESNTGGMS